MQLNLPSKGKISISCENHNKGFFQDSGIGIPKDMVHVCLISIPKLPEKEQMEKKAMAWECQLLKNYS